MKLLVDTNVILDWLQKREPYFTAACNVITKCLLESQITGYVSAHSLCDVFYILRKDFPTENRFQLIHFLAAHFKVIAETQEDFLHIASSPEITDLEDGLQMLCAQKMQLDYIVTRNLDDFNLSVVPAILPEHLPLT